MTDTMTATTEQRSEPPPAGAGLLIGVLVISAFVMILNETILSVALHDLTGDLGITTTTVQWLTSGFLLTMAVVIPTTGFLLERFTPRRVFLISLSLFSLGTLIGGLAPGFGVLMVGRVVQACGTAVMIPLLMTTVMRLIPVHRRGATMGTIGIVIAVAPAIGPTVGGLVLAVLDWRWMFFIVLPLALAALAIGALRLRVPSETRSLPLNVPSVVLSALGFGGVLYGLSALGHPAGAAQPIPPWLPLIVGVVATTLFVWRQLRLQRRDAALLDLRPLTYRNFAVGLGLIMPLFLCLIGVAAILLPLYLQTVLRTGTFVSGLAVLPGGLMLGLLGRPVGMLFDRVGARPLVLPGAIAMAVALWLFTTLGEGSPLGLVIGFHVLFMGGLALMMTPLMTYSLDSLPSHLYSHGSAILATLQQVAAAFGTAAFVTVAALGTANPSGEPDAAGLRTAFVVAGCVGVLTVLVALLVRGGNDAGDTGSGTGTGTAGNDTTDHHTADGTAVDDSAAGTAGHEPVRAASTAALPD